MFEIWGYCVIFVGVVDLVDGGWGGCVGCGCELCGGWVVWCVVEVVCSLI